MPISSNIIDKIEALISNERNNTANMSNICAHLMAEGGWHWVGFYTVDKENDQLVLGPFQGPVACTRLNRGKGYSLRKAFKLCIDKNYKFAITLDADGQHDPSLINDFVNKDNRTDIIIGARKISYPMPLHRRFSNFITSFLLSVRCGINIQDSQCGYRKYNLETFLKDYYNLKV